MYMYLIICRLLPGLGFACPDCNNHKKPPYTISQKHKLQLYYWQIMRFYSSNVLIRAVLFIYEHIVVSNGLELDIIKTIIQFSS